MLRRTLEVASTLVLLVGSGACNPARDAQTSDTAAPELAPPTTVEAKGALATRHEAQALFDRARESYVRKDLTAAGAALREASAFLKLAADSAPEESRRRLQSSADDLDGLADKVIKGDVRTAANLDAIFARAQGAEAERHHADALGAWARKDYTRAGEELLMAVDHLERGAKDAGMVLTKDAQKVIADAREISGQLISGTGFAADRVGTVTDALRKEIRDFGAKIEKRRS